jgi:cellulose synthase/poly-beta-1,6-N-acetylglucosamine synthase-like glycosyltransferase
LRLRNLGYHIEFAPYAECATDAPTKLKVLVKQRRRWEWAVVTFECRKHIDMANPFSRNFRISNCILFYERWLFNLILPIAFWVYTLLLCLTWEPGSLLNMLLLFYFVYVLIEYCQWLCILFYSNHPRQDARLFYVPPLVPLYQMLQRLVTSVAIAEEMLTRRSFRDGFVPQHVRERTWQW